MTSREAAIRAQEKLLDQLERQPWFRGIALLADDKGSHYLRVNLKAATDAGKVPKAVDGVPITTLVVGEMRPL